MASTLIQFRADDTEKIEAMEICEKLGLNLQSYLKMCLSRLVQERGIPFSMHVQNDSKYYRNMLDEINRKSEERGVADMTLEEINAEIAEARKGK